MTRSTRPPHGDNAGGASPATTADWERLADDMTFAQLERVSDEFLALTAEDVQRSLHNRTQVGLVKFESLVEMLALRAAAPRSDSRDAWRRLRNYLTAVVDLTKRARAAMQSGVLIARNPLTATALPPPFHPRRYIESQLIQAFSELRATAIINTLDGMLLPALRRKQSETRVAEFRGEVYVRPDAFSGWAVAEGIVANGEIDLLLQPRSENIHRAAQRREKRIVTHGEAILNALRGLGFNPSELPETKGRAGPKAAARKALFGTVTDSQFDHAWDEWLLPQKLVRFGRRP